MSQLVLAINKRFFWLLLHMAVRVLTFDQQKDFAL
jgi:hypothetical protein